MRILAILLLACLAGCAPKVGTKRTFMYWDARGHAYVIDVVIGNAVRVPVLDRGAKTNPAGGNDGDESTH